MIKNSEELFMSEEHEPDMTECMCGNIHDCPECEAVERRFESMWTWLWCGKME